MLGWLQSSSCTGGFSCLCVTGRSPGIGKRCIEQGAAGVTAVAGTAYEMLQVREAVYGRLWLPSMTSLIMLALNLNIMHGASVPCCQGNVLLGTFICTHHYVGGLAGEVQEKRLMNAMALHAAQKHLNFEERWQIKLTDSLRLFSGRSTWTRREASNRCQPLDDVVPPASTWSSSVVWPRLELKLMPQMASRPKISSCCWPKLS